MLWAIAKRHLAGGFDQGWLCNASYLEHLDLAAGRVEMLRVFPILILLKCVNLHPKRHSFLAPMLPGGEFCADTVHLEAGGPEVREGRSLDALRLLSPKE